MEHRGALENGGGRSRRQQYNLLGIFDDDLNKRNHFQRTTEYRQESPGLAFSPRYAAW